jgi:2,3-bisphosphoglycerate-independent phosphoglycerate mutase
MRRVLLCILDGWGERVLDQNNGLSFAHNWQDLLKKYPHTFLNASESHVGLPDGQMGNSEVGHLTLGLGRKIPQDLPRINDAIDDGTFKESDTFREFIKRTKSGSNCCHVMGLFSPGGVHSHEDHFLYVVKILAEEGITVVVHPILDGRDTSPSSAILSLQKLETLLSDQVKPGTVSGRYFAMDRDNRWERTKSAYDAFIHATGNRYKTIIDAVQCSYSLGITDEFVKPCVISDYEGVTSQDSFFFINFRGDRARQWISALTLPSFDHFSATHPRFSAILTMTDYSKELSPYHLTLFPKIPLTDGLGETIANHSLCQLRIAETEKYAHVTYFFNGGKEAVFDGEERIMVPSPQVATYDLKPEMSAEQVTEHVLSALNFKKHHLIVVNYANPDMVGHTGVRSAIEKAIKTIDSILIRLEKEALKNDWVLIITADHGNVEQITDDMGQPHTAHTCNVVPFLVINGGNNLKLKHNGTLADVAPTILQWLNLPVPNVMSGHCLQQL